MDIEYEPVTDSGLSHNILFSKERTVKLSILAPSCVILILRLPKNEE